MFSFLRIFTVFLVSFVSFFLILNNFAGAYSSNFEISITIILFSLFSSLVVWRINRIRIKLIAKQTDSFGSEKGNDPSGRYLIAELRHLIGRGKSETQLKLIRDVFTPSTDAEVQRDNEMYGDTFPAGSF